MRAALGEKASGRLPHHVLEMWSATPYVDPDYMLPPPRRRSLALSARPSTVDPPAARKRDALPMGACAFAPGPAGTDARAMTAATPFRPSSDLASHRPPPHSGLALPGDLTSRAAAMPPTFPLHPPSAAPVAARVAAVHSFRMIAGVQLRAQSTRVHETLARAGIPVATQTVERALLLPTEV